MHATAAGVRAVPLTRVARDFVSGVARGIAESRATAVLLEWSGRRDWRRSIFNDRLDRLVARTEQLVMVAKVEGTIKTLHRVVVVLAPKVEQEPGFDDAIRAIKLMASRLSADIVFYTVGTGSDETAARVDRVRQTVRRTFESVADWRSLRTQLERSVADDHLVMLVSERPGMVGWHHELNQMPRRLANLARNVCVMYPSVIEPAEEHDDHVRTLLNEALQAGRLAVALENVDIGEAVEELLGSEFGDDSARLLAATTAMAPVLAEGATEVSPGVTILLGHMDDLALPLLFLGLSRTGIAMRGVTEPARVLSIVLVPPDHRKSVTAYAEELRRLLCNASRVEELARCTTIPSVAQFFRSAA